MPITMNDLAVGFEHIDQTTVLSEWTWLLGDRKLPILIGALGDAFVQDRDDGSVHLLSAGGGSLRQVAANVDEFQALLGDRDFVIRHFAPEVIVELRNMGQHLEPGQLYGYKVPPFLGGSYSLDNLEPTDIRVHFSMLGQLLRQTQGLEPGTPIRGVEFE
jgi:hypothetical protein